ncbi:MAG: YcxB family protein [Terriglobales bacterium]
MNLIPPLGGADRFLPGNGTSPLVFVVAFGFCGFILPYLIAREQYKGPDLSDPTHYTFDANGYEVVQPVWRYRVDWTSVREIRESKSMFLLYLNPTQRNIIPKRFFPDGQALAAWRSLIAARAPSVPIRRNSIAGRFL